MTARLCALLGWAAVQHAHAAEATAVKPRFDVLEIRVLGNTVLPATDIERAVYPYLGPAKAVEDMEGARLALETLYHERGYGTVFVDLPEQEVADGLVRLKVTEGRLRAAKVSGARYFSERHILAALPGAASGTVPNLPQLQRELAAVNAASRDRAVQPILKAGPTPGSVDLALKVQDHLPLHASVELNNQYTGGTQPLRVIGSVSYDHLFGRFDSIGLQYQTAPQNRRQVDVWLGSYTTHWQDSATRLALYYLKSNSEVASLGSADISINVLGKGQVAGLRVIRPLPSAPDGLRTLTLGADYKDFLQDVRLLSLKPTAPGNSGATGLATPINYLNFSLAYSEGRRSEAGQWAFSASANFGIRGLINNPSDFANKRYLARANYLYLRSDGSQVWQLPARWTLLLKYAAQLAAEPIISNEQFSIAGNDGVRGYLEAEELSDRGIKAAAQLGTPVWRAHERFSVSGFAFFDYGRISEIDPLPSEIASVDLRSVGLGLELFAWQHVSGSLTWARPLVSGAQTLRGEARYLFSFRTTW